MDQFISGNMKRNFRHHIRRDPPRGFAMSELIIQALTHLTGKPIKWILTYILHCIKMKRTAQNPFQGRKKQFITTIGIYRRELKSKHIHRIPYFMLVKFPPHIRFGKSLKIAAVRLYPDTISKPLCLSVGVRKFIISILLDNTDNFSHQSLSSVFILENQHFPNC